MPRTPLFPLMPLFSALLMAAPAAAEIRLPATVSSGILCRQAIGAAERAHAIPDSLLASIGRVESGRRDADGTFHPWPWTINAEGEGHFFESKAEAIAAVRVLQARGVQSIDVGCTQVNLMHHPDAFASLEQAFDPSNNANYAAKFLVQLHDQTQDWGKAAAFYHSQTPELGADYQRKVMAVWPEEKSRSGEAQRLQVGKIWAMNHGAEPIPVSPAGRVAVMLPVSRAEPPIMLPTGAAADDPAEIAHRWSVAHGAASESPMRGKRGGAAPATSAAAGRGLDSYRAAPIQAVGPTMVANR